MCSQLIRLNKYLKTLKTSSSNGNWFLLEIIMKKCYNSLAFTYTEDSGNAGVRPRAPYEVLRSGAADHAAPFFIACGRSCSTLENKSDKLRGSGQRPDGRSPLLFALRNIITTHQIIHAHIKIICKFV